MIKCDNFFKKIMGHNNLKQKKHPVTKICKISDTIGQGGKSCANGVCKKVWTPPKILSPNIRYFFALLKFLCILQSFFQLKIHDMYGYQKQCPHVFVNTHKNYVLISILVIRAKTTFLSQISQYATDQRIEFSESLPTSDTLHQDKFT